MAELDLFRFYNDCLLPLTPSAPVVRILKIVMAGGETTEDFAQLVTLDSELQHWIRLTVQRLGFDRRVSKMSQMVTLLGQNRIRDVIIGRNMERAFMTPDQTLLGQAKVKGDKEASELAKKGLKPPDKDEKAAASSGNAEVSEAMEIIPVLGEYQKYLICANRAEEVAIAIRNSYPGQAFSGGVLFDYAKAFLNSRKVGEKLKEPKLVNTDRLVDEMFTSGLRCGLAANEIIQKISIPHQKNVFVTAILHNIGKVLLLAYDPVAFERAFQASSAIGPGADEEKKKTRVDSAEAESMEFDFDHAQAGSLFLARIPHLSEIERSVDFHHNPTLLRFTNPGLYALACVLRISGGLERLYQAGRSQNLDIDKIPDQRLTHSKEYEFLKLNEGDWKEIKGTYALNLMKTGL